ncbi:MAG: DUF3341 domain-containing protein [Planctomycetota bacterium]
MTRTLHIGWFAAEQDLLGAVAACRSLGIRVVDVHSPHPVHGIDAALGIPHSRLGWVTFAAGAAGGTLGLLFQYWASASDWPLNVGGKPFDSFPAFVPVAFETTVLFAGLATAAAMILRSGLRPGRRSRRSLAAATDDRYALVVTRDDAACPADALPELWKRHGAVATSSEAEDLP